MLTKKSPSPRTLAARNQRIRALLASLDRHHPGEGAHAQRVAVYAVATGERMGLELEELRQLREAALLHDIGKLRVDRSILVKSGAFSAEERDQVQLHSILRADGWNDLEFESIGPIVRGHHERFDGAGYPDGLRGEEIPLGARILAVAESFDAMLNDAPHRTAFDEDQALKEIAEQSGKMYDPKVVEAFLVIQQLIQPVL